MNTPYPHLPAFEEKMRAEGLPAMVIDAFAHYYRQVVDGETGIIEDSAIRPMKEGEVVFAEDLERHAEAGRRVRERAVRITLNGGLGTSMGLTGPKSLLVVKEGRTFLDVILAQSRADGVRQAFMNSFSTDAATREAIGNDAGDRAPLLFVQNRFPKILQSDGSPARWPRNPAKEWNPPGHGDIYAAIYAGGTLERLLSEGIRYAFIHNSDNLGATLDEPLLGFFAESGLPFMMEAARRNPVDFKGGHLAVRLRDGRLVLRESAQCPRTTTGTDVSLYRYFNTNNLWVDLRKLRQMIEAAEGVRLPLIVNPKTLDPRDPDSPPVYQLETAMGAAIELFEGAKVVVVPRSRFLPVKKCNDLLVVRSDRYRFDDRHRLETVPGAGEAPPRISLDPAFYGRIDDFDARFEDGVPSLRQCRSLAVEGDVRFGPEVRIVGDVRLRNRSGSQQKIGAGSVLDRDRAW